MSDSLFHIEAELAELVSARDGLAESGAPDEAIAEVDAQIAEYCRREVREADRLRGYLRHCDHMAEGAKEEAHRQTELAELWVARRDRLKASILHIMQDMGIKKVEGRNGTLAVRANPPSVQVQPELLPAEYFRPPKEPEPDKTKIKLALKRGEAVPGAWLESTDRLEVR